MAQPKATSRSPRLGVEPAEVAVDAVGQLDLRRKEVDPTGDRTVALQDEGPVVESALAAEALRQPPRPGPLLARRPVLGERHDVLETGERTEALRAHEAGAEQHVLVREGEEGTAVLVGHDALEGRLGPRRAVHQGQSDQEGGRATDALEGAKGVATQLVPLPGQGDEHPGLPLLGEVSDVEPRWAFAAQIGHFDQLSVAERSAILGGDDDRHTGQFTGCALGVPNHDRPSVPHPRGRDPAQAGNCTGGQARTAP